MRFSPETTNSDRWDLVAVQAEINKEFNLQQINISDLDIEELGVNGVMQLAAEQISEAYQEKVKHLDPRILAQLESQIYLQIIDVAWKDHLLSMDNLKDAVSLRGYAQRDPLQEYKKEAFNLFNGMWMRIEEDMILTLVRMPQPQVEYVDRHEEELAEDESRFHLHHSDPDQIPEEPRVQQRAPEPVQPFRRETEKVGRNAACPCGSGKKYKKCHGRPGAVAQMQP